MRQSRLMTLAPLIMVAIAGFACGESPGSSGGGGGTAATAGPQTAAIGSPLVSNDGKTVTVTKFEPTYGDNALTDAGKQCIAVDVTLENKSKDEWNGININFSVLDANGVKSDLAFGCGAPAGPDALTPGGHATSLLSFEVTKGATGLKLTWQPSLLDKTTFTVPLA